MALTSLTSLNSLTSPFAKVESVNYDAKIQFSCESGNTYK